MPRTQQLSRGKSRKIRHGDRVSILDSAGLPVGTWTADFSAAPGDGKCCTLISVDEEAQTGNNESTGRPVSLDKPFAACGQ